MAGHLGALGDAKHCRGGATAPPGRVRALGDLLWARQAFLSGGPAELLSGHGRQVMRLVVREVPCPQDEQNLEPLRGERADRMMVPVSPRATSVVVRLGPLTVRERVGGELVAGLPQMLVAGEAEEDGGVLAAAVGDGDAPGVRLEMPEALPA